MSDHLKFLFFFPWQNNKTKTQTIKLELLYIKKIFFNCSPSYLLKKILKIVKLHNFFQNYFASMLLHDNTNTI